MTGPDMSAVDLEELVAEIGAKMKAEMPSIVAASLAEMLGMPGNEAAIEVIRNWIDETNTNAGRHEL